MGGRRGSEVRVRLWRFHSRPADGWGGSGGQGNAERWFAGLLRMRACAARRLCFFRGEELKQREGEIKLVSTSSGWLCGAVFTEEVDTGGSMGVVAHLSF
ncbi:Hypothetical predicted protein [Podarcis lilfordi]|uniref:Uncharacterized protein n=1 Tax=Podarcis lilfordi TaxID=74358 RepID=A0AA35K5N0_9SAUR|nr:Hypothetical predicted protein [Podarcis lilfordi]